VREFRTGNGAAWLDFLVTVLGRHRLEQREMLNQPADLRDWLAEHGLAPATAVTQQDVDDARSLRETLFRLARSAVLEEPAAASDVRGLNDALSAESPLRVQRRSSALVLSRPADAAAALTRLAHQAAVDLTGPARERLRFCGDDSCAGIFLDQTGRRRWCSDERCGVRSRVRAHRARARAPEAPRHGQT
jgi:predicted RNA-binding Zn ribbon-like protein